MTIVQENKSAVVGHDVVFRVSSREYQIAVERQALRRRLGMGGPEVDFSIILREVFLEDAMTVSPLLPVVSSKVQELSAEQLIQCFWDEVELQLVWDFVPFSFIYDLYEAWTRGHEVPSHRKVARKTLVMAVCVYVESSSRLWVSEGYTVTKRPGKRLDAPEPLARAYGLTQWIEFEPRDFYRGLIRR